MKQIKNKEFLEKYDLVWDTDYEKCFICNKSPIGEIYFISKHELIGMMTEYLLIKGFTIKIHCQEYRAYELYDEPVKTYKSLYKCLKKAVEWVGK